MSGDPPSAEWLHGVERPAAAWLHRADRTVARVLRRFFAGGWGARLTFPLGLEGHVRVESHVFPVPRPPGASRPLRIGFASDFHAGSTTHPALLAEACRALAEMRPDLLLLGGDFVAFDAEEVDELVPLLARIPAPLGRYAVLGNHDLTADRAYVSTALERAGIELLTNRSVRLPAPYDDLSLCGLDDPTFGAPRADLAFDGASETRLVLMHSPDGLLAIGDRRFEIAFCGHTHGGQIALPTGHALVVPWGRLSRRFSRGTFELRDSARLLVSRGVGCTSVPLRLFAAPQVHSCVILPAVAAAEAA